MTVTYSREATHKENDLTPQPRAQNGVGENREICSWRGEWGGSGGEAGGGGWGTKKNPKV